MALGNILAWFSCIDLFSENVPKVAKTSFEILLTVYFLKQISTFLIPYHGSTFV